MNGRLNSILLLNNDFRTFRNNLHHYIKNHQIQEIILELIDNDIISYFYNNGKLLESLYLLSMLDTFCIACEVPVISEYNWLRNKCFENPIIIGDQVNLSSDEIYPEFLKHNIWEGDLFDAV